LRPSVHIISFDAPINSARCAQKSNVGNTIGFIAARGAALGDSGSLAAVWRAAGPFRLAKKVESEIRYNRPEQKLSH
jgi:hypothetical protein